MRCRPDENPKSHNRLILTAFNIMSPDSAVHFRDRWQTDDWTLSQESWMEPDKEKLDCILVWLLILRVSEATD